MAALEFPEFLRRFQLQLLAVATEVIVPGTVLDRRKRGFQPQGHLRELLPRLPPRFWKVERRPANLVYGTVERSLNLGGQASLSEMGLEIEGGLARASSVTFAISRVSAKTFREGAGGASKFALVPLVTALRKSNRAAWRMVNGKWVVLETYHASEASVSFAVDAGVDLRAEVDAAGGARLRGGGTVKWTGKRSFTITGNDAVPFAFRGWMV